MYILKDSVKVLLDIHHIIFDGTSFAVFLKELSDRYNGIKVIDKHDMDFSQSISSKELERAKQFFLDEFSGDLPVNDLPYDRPRKKI